MKKYLTLPNPTVVKQFQEWKGILDHNSVGHIFFLPHTGLLYRAHQFVDWLTQQKYNLPIIDLDLEMSADPRSFADLLSKNPLPSLIVARTNFLGVDRRSLSQILQNYYTENQCSMLIFHEGSPMQLEGEVRLPSVMFQNNIIYSLPEKIAVFKYIENFAIAINVAISDHQKAEIYELCGNQPWLINELMRLLSTHPTAKILELFHSDSIIKRIEYLWSHLYLSHQQYLLNHKQSDKEREMSQQELIDFGYIEPKTLQPIGKWLIDAVSSAKSSMVNISENSISINGVELKYAFSQGEIRIISTLWEKKSASRAELAQQFWDDESEESYTDWALDQVISRLRKKLILHNVPIEIKTKRGSGYAI
jgi:hypothetical protein